MKLLAIDTATEGCSAALWHDGQIASRMQVKARAHADLILPMLDELLADSGVPLSQLDALAFGRGPGAFTGVRIATGVIQGMAFGADLPVVPVSTLRALAQRVFNEHQHACVLSAFDARMDEVYWAAYQADQKGLMQLLDEELVIGPKLVQIPSRASEICNKRWAAAGSGWQAYPDMLNADPAIVHRYPDMITRANEVAMLAVAEFEAGMAVSAEQALPVYLRNQVAKKKLS